MRSIILEPGKTPYMKDIAGEYEELTSIVGGYLESMRLRGGAYALFDEEGIIKGKMPGHVISDAYGNAHHIVGTAVIVGCNPATGLYVDVPNSTAKQYGVL